MKTLNYLLLAVLITACGQGPFPLPPKKPAPPPPPPPVEGTVLSEECVEYTLVQKIADGKGGSYEELTQRSPDCGWNPPPYGELFGTECDGYALVTTYHDGEYGFYEVREKDAEICGFIPPVFNVAIDNTYGDRFRPVVVTVEYMVQGEPAEWTYEVEMGRAEKVSDDTLHIYGDGTGNSVDFLLYINGESFLYHLKEEPRCGVEDSKDCLGYTQYGEWDLIYYHEEDTDIVDVELMVAVYDYDSTSPVPLTDTEDSRYKKVVTRVSQYNEMMDKSGIFINWVLKEVYLWRIPDLHGGEDFTRSIDVDIGLGMGVSYPDTCGVAYPNVSFDRAGFGLSRCGYQIDLHELGHVVGLAHGPNNSAYNDEGYIFPEFGHGDYDQCGSRTDDIMSYGSKDHFFNSKKDCDDVFPGKGYAGPSGDRLRADSAYHWNRIRYDLSLIHDEHTDRERPAPLTSMEETRELIVD